MQDSAFRRYHANQWTVGEHHWLPPGAWQACADPTATILPGQRIFVGVDVGGERSASAVVWVTEDLRVDCAIYTGNEAVLACAAKVRDLAEQFTVVEVIADPWRFQQSMLELPSAACRSRSFRSPTLGWGRRRSACTRRSSSGGCHIATIPPLNAHVRQAIARDTPRGWRLDKLKSRDNIDAVVALAMAVEAAEAPTPTVELLGWL